MSWLKYIWNNEDTAAVPLTREQYQEDLEFTDDKYTARIVLEKAWAIRNFEIEMYWKRANYFWAFIASSFVGYFALINSESYCVPDGLNHVEVYFMICIGFALSVAWVFVNRGSKTWQRHWEAHIDLLEDRLTGPLYKTVYSTKTYSVSKINEIISIMFALIWILLAIKYFIEQDVFNYGDGVINWLIIIASIIVVLAVISMVRGYGRGRFRNREFRMYRRKITYK